MDFIEDNSPHSSFSEFVDRLFRNPLGNFLLLLNLFLISRTILIHCAVSQYVQDCEIGRDWLFDDGPSLLLALYYLIHIPTWATLYLIMWLTRPFLNFLYPETLCSLEGAIFVLLSSVQWLALGYLYENRLLSRILGVKSMKGESINANTYSEEEETLIIISPS